MGLHEPDFMPEFFGSRVYPSSRKGITSQNPPHPQQDPHDRPVIIDTPFGIFRTGGLIQTGVPGEASLVKKYHADAERGQIGFKHGMAKNFPILRCQPW